MRARIRSIKPEVHMDEELWDLEVETGLPIFRAFTGMWNMSDREGRFEWRPRALKAAILPYWDGDFSRVLDALATRGFLRRYTSVGREFGVIDTFTRHQAINGKEPPSELPAPPLQLGELTQESTRDSRVNNASSTRPGTSRVERNGTERNGTEQRVGDARTREPLDSSDVESEPFGIKLIARRFSELRKISGGDGYHRGVSDYQAVQDVESWALEHHADAPLAAVEQSITNFLRDDYARSAGWPFKLWAADAGKWHCRRAEPAPEPSKGAAYREWRE